MAGRHRLCQIGRAGQAAPDSERFCRAIGRGPPSILYWPRTPWAAWPRRSEPRRSEWCPPLAKGATLMSRYEGLALVLLRAVVGFVSIQHACQKLFGVLGGRAVPLGSMLGAAGVIELIGGALIFLGLFTRPAAFILAGEMASAYFMAH